MSNIIPGNHKHLTLEDRLYIEESLNNGKSFREISKYICKDPSTVSKEVWKHRIVNTWNRGSFNNPYNFCVHRYHCRKMNACDKLFICDTKCRSCHRCNNVCKDFVREHCVRIERAPFVCNGCANEPHKCPIHTKYTYNAKAAQRHYEELLKSSREGINLTKKELRQIDRIVRPLIEQGQSPYMILTNHPELGLSVTTLYNYIDQGVLLTKNIDLKRKVKFKKRTTHDTQIKNREIFIGRTYSVTRRIIVPTYRSQAANYFRCIPFHLYLNVLFFTARFFLFFLTVHSPFFIVYVILKKEKEQPLLQFVLSLSTSCAASKALVQDLRPKDNGSLLIAVTSTLL